MKGVPALRRLRRVRARLVGVGHGAYKMTLHAPPWELQERLPPDALRVDADAHRRARLAAVLLEPRHRAALPVVRNRREPPLLEGRLEAEPADRKSVGQGKGGGW